ncbi:MAG: Fic family protein [Microgenomates group bacterium]
MYSPKFTITNDILLNIGLIEAAREVIKNAPLIPVYEARFVKDAIVRTVHHGTHLEGNDLTLAETKRIIEGENILSGHRDVQEVINYRKVLEYLDELEKEAKEGFYYNSQILKKINEIVCERIPLEGETKPGEFRSVQVVLKDERTGEVVFRPPPAIEVPFLVESFLDWLNSPEGKKIHPVLRAGIAHYFLVACHPFVEGNGRTARAFATLILFLEGYDIKKFFSLEEYFDKDAHRYYQALTLADQSGPLEERDLTPWLEYFTQAMAVELTRIKEQVKRLSLDVKVKSKVGYQIPLNSRQVRLMEYLEEKGSITTQEARRLIPEYSEDTLLRDLNYFVSQGIAKKQGKTKGARYMLK